MSVMGTVAGNIRAGITAPPGKKLVVCDLGSIESRVLGWMAGCKRINDIFAQGLDTYKDFATDLYQIPYDAVTKEQRTFCKPPVLGCGYRLGAKGLVKYAASMGVEMSGKDAKKAVRTFRDAYWEVHEMWEWFDEHAKACVTSGAQATGHKVTLWRDDQFLHIRLPSGRDLHYYQPLVEPRTLTVVDPESGEERKWETMAVTYMGMDTYTHQWKRISTHGGKLVENCLAEGTEVLTQRGWVPIEHVENADLVHDGESLVIHRGKIFKSVQDCVNIDGVYMTPDHKVLDENGTWKAASTNPKPYRPEIRGAEMPWSRALRWAQKILAFPLRLWHQDRESRGGYHQRNKKGWNPQLWLSDWKANWLQEHHAREVQAPSVRGLEINDRSVSVANASSMAQLRCERNFCLPTMVYQLSKFLERYVPFISTGANSGEDEQQQKLHTLKLPMERLQAPGKQQEIKCVGRNGSRSYDNLSSLQSLWDSEIDNSLPTHKGAPHRVYDLLNCGPSHRFVVKGANGPFIVHNCDQAISRDILAGV